MITSISRITIFVQNQEVARKFWIEQMGFQIVFEQPMQQHTWLEVAPKTGGTRFVLYDKALMKTQNPNANTGHPSLILSTTNIEQTHATLKGNGVNIEPISHMPYGKMCSFSDPDGNNYMLREDALV